MIKQTIDLTDPVNTIQSINQTIVRTMQASSTNKKTWQYENLPFNVHFSLKIPLENSPPQKGSSRSPGLTAQVVFAGSIDPRSRI